MGHKPKREQFTATWRYRNASEYSHSSLYHGDGTSMNRLFHRLSVDPAAPDSTWNHLESGMNFAIYRKWSGMIVREISYWGTSAELIEKFYCPKAIFHWQKIWPIPVMEILTSIWYKTIMHKFCMDEQKTIFWYEIKYWFVWGPRMSHILANNPCTGIWCLQIFHLRLS